ncbi:MAG: S24 family peptidase [Phycisphaerae bacterium]
MAALRDKLAKLVAQRGWSMRRLAAEAKIPNATLSNAMNGHSMRVEAAIAVARAMDVPVEWLFDTQADDTPPRRPFWLPPGVSLATTAAPNAIRGMTLFRISAGRFSRRRSLARTGTAEFLRPEDVTSTAGHVPIVSLVSAGLPREARGCAIPKAVADLYLRFSTDDPAAFALRVDGDSMAPCFKHHDLIVVSPTPGHELGAFRDGMLAVVLFGGERTATFKIIEFARSDVREPMVEYILRPINKAHPLLRLRVGEVAAIMPVVAAAIAEERR